MTNNAVAYEAGGEITPVHNVLGRIVAGEITATKDAGSGNELSELDG